MSGYEEMMAHEEMLCYLAQEDYVIKNLPARYTRLVEELEACTKTTNERDCTRIFESEIERAANHRTWLPYVRR